MHLSWFAFATSSSAIVSEDIQAGRKGHYRGVMGIIPNFAVECVAYCHAM